MASISLNDSSNTSGLQHGKTRYILLLTLVATLGGLLFGYDTAVVNGAEKSLVEFYISSGIQPDTIRETTLQLVLQYQHMLVIVLAIVTLIISMQLIKLLQWKRGIAGSAVLLILLSVWGIQFWNRPVPQDSASLQLLGDAIKGFVISGALVGCIIGGAVSGMIMRWLGRKYGLLAAAVAFIVSAIGTWHPEWFNLFGVLDVYAFVIYRIIGGIGVGLASMISPVYIAEIAPANSRGKLVSFNQFAIILGMLVIYFVNYFIAGHGDENWLREEGWRWMFFSGVIPAGLFFILLLLVPETPRYLVLKGKDQEALNVLRKISGNEEAPVVLQQIKSSLTEHHAPWMSFGGKLIVVGILLSVFQQFVGINVVLYYAGNIFRNMGASTNSSLLQTIVIGAVNLLFTVVAILRVDQSGRKPLMIIGSIGMALSMLGLGFSFYFQQQGWMALICMLLYTASFAMSWGPVCWVLLAEIFPNSIRAALSVAVAAQWIANWMVSLTFPMLNDNEWLTHEFHHGFAYWIYAGMSALSAFFIWKMVPETKGRSLEEIEQLWNKKTSA